MKKIEKLILISMISIFIGVKAEAQTADPITIVEKFGSYMAEWSKTKNLDFLFKIIDELFPDRNNNNGITQCIVNDKLSDVIIKRDEMLTRGISIYSQTYLLGLAKAIEKGMRYKYKKPVWHKEYKSRIIDQDIPVQFVSMEFSTSGSIECKGRDLFLVQGDYIVKIVDFDSSLAKELE